MHAYTHTRTHTRDQKLQICNRKSQARLCGEVMFEGQIGLTRQSSMEVWLPGSGKSGSKGPGPSGRGTVQEVAVKRWERRSARPVGQATQDPLVPVMRNQP